MKKILAALILALAVSAQAADVADAQAVRFANEKARVVADELLSAYKTCLAMQLYWNANPSLAGLLPNVAASFATDGANTGGSTTFTSATGTFVAGQVNHSIQILNWTSGTCVKGPYEITARASGTSITLATSPCSVTATGITYEVGDAVVDGAAPRGGNAGDGRQPITSTDAASMVTQCNTIITNFQANSNAILNALQGVSVNSAPRF